MNATVILIESDIRIAIEECIERKGHDVRGSTLHVEVIHDDRDGSTTHKITAKVSVDLKDNK